eukprot:TRINITY_DN2743_c0_g1_i1.p1 TRINITY_DN2743_c0_g1~~TRINITY_DN2743_c0_g1_i1.p1  ORF type:complete len:252 (-),score=3.52 TRINITY_DN2743_c0_g1_i1:278-1033(-)
MGQLWHRTSASKVITPNPLLSSNVKAILVGDESVGKTSLVRVGVRQACIYAEPTIGCAFLCKKVLVDDQDVQLQIWDTAGQERYGRLAQMYFRGAQIIFMCFDLAHRQSFLNLHHWFEDQVLPSIPATVRQKIVIAVVGCKEDLVFAANERAVSYDEIRCFCTDLQHKLLAASTPSNTVIPTLALPPADICYSQLPLLNWKSAFQWEFQNSGRVFYVETSAKRDTASVDLLFERAAQVYVHSTQTELEDAL